MCACLCALYHMVRPFFDMVRSACHQTLYHSPECRCQRRYMNRGVLRCIVTTVRPLFLQLRHAFGFVLKED